MQGLQNLLGNWWTWDFLGELIEFLKALVFTRLGSELATQGI